MQSSREIKDRGDTWGFFLNYTLKFHHQTVAV